MLDRMFPVRAMMWLETAKETMLPRVCAITAALLLVVVLMSSNIVAQSSSGKPAPLQVSILTPPTAFRGDGQWHLCYEIYVNNLSPYSWSVQSIEAKSDNGTALIDLSGKDLDAALFHPARQPNQKGKLAAEIGPGEAFVAYMWINLPQSAPIPSRLLHQFAVKKDNASALYTVDAPSAAIASLLPQIESPLRGNNWVAANGPSNTSAHRRALIVIDGAPHFAQRYAIDWVQAGSDSQTFTGDPHDNHSYHCFGAEAHAIADGVVVEVKDGIPENTPRSDKLAVPITLETVAGNHVNLDLGGGVYAMYAHLQPGSIRVKVGDKVTAGQVIGLVGNTGNSSEPHLHFQLMNRNSPMASDGIPYTFANYEIVGKMAGDENNPKVDRLATPETRHGEIPMEDEVVDFEQ